jgi:DAK2 domain fusion protein YloV
LREFIDGAAFSQMVLRASEALENDKQRINDLNVFPVPDGDTGTNMSLTLSAAAAELRKKEPGTITECADTVASAMLRGARGNSGVILSLLFRGLSKGLKGLEAAGPAEFSAAMSRGVRAAYKAVMKPTEGTILTVSRLASAAAEEFAAEGSDIELMLTHAIEAGREAVADTQNLNPVLKRAGVVDAGGEGYIVILDAMLASLEGRAVAKAEPAEAQPQTGNVFAEFDEGEINFTYCTEFIVEKANTKSPMILREFLEGLGDCVVVVDDDEIIKTHVHTNDPGKVLTEALTYGALATVKIENMRKQHTEQMGAAAAAPAAPAEDASPAPAEKKYGAVAVCAGAGLEKLFRELGADGVVSGGQTMNPSTEDILREVNRTPAEIVFVFPNNKNIIMAAQQCAALSEKKVVVIPTRTVPQGVTAMLNMDASMEEDELADTFNSVIEGVHTALVTYAARDSEFSGYHIKAGEYLALMDGALIGSYDNQEALLAALGDKLEELSPEFLSVYYGCDVSEQDALDFSGVLEERFADAELTLLSGGQPVYYYMISAE